MAVRRARISATPIPAQMSAATELPSGAVAAACSWYVIQRNAPGAISAIAFTVTPVSPSVGLTVVCSAMGSPFVRAEGATAMPPADDVSTRRAAGSPASSAGRAQKTGSSDRSAGAPRRGRRRDDPFRGEREDAAIRHADPPPARSACGAYAPAEDERDLHALAALGRVHEA